MHSLFIAYCYIFLPVYHIKVTLLLSVEALCWHLVAIEHNKLTHIYAHLINTIYYVGKVKIYLVVMLLTVWIYFFFPQVVDTLFIGRYVLLAVASAVFLVAFFMLLPFHFLEPVYAKALRTH